MATRNMVAKIACVLTLACMFCASSVQAGNLVCGGANLVCGGASEDEKLSRMMLARIGEVSSGNYLEMIKKIDEMFQDPATLALMENHTTDNCASYAIALCRTVLYLNAVLESGDSAAFKIDSRRWVTMCLKAAKSKFEHGDFNSALLRLDLACLNPAAAKLMLDADSGSDYEGFLRDIARLWLKAKLAQSKKLLQSREETQQAQNGGDTSEQWRIMQQENDRELRRLEHEARMDELRLKQYELEAKRREDAIRREQHRINMDRVRRTAESFQGMFGD